MSTAVVIPATEVEEPAGCRETGKDITLLYSHSQEFDITEIYQKFAKTSIQTAGNKHSTHMFSSYWTQVNLVTDLWVRMSVSAVSEYKRFLQS